MLCGTSSQSSSAIGGDRRRVEPPSTDAIASTYSRSSCDSSIVAFCAPACSSARRSSLINTRSSTISPEIVCAALQYRRRIEQTLADFVAFVRAADACEIAHRQVDEIADAPCAGVGPRQTVVADVRLEFAFELIALRQRAPAQIRLIGVAHEQPREVGARRFVAQPRREFVRDRFVVCEAETARGMRGGFVTFERGSRLAARPRDFGFDDRDLRCRRLATVALPALHQRQWLAYRAIASAPPVRSVVNASANVNQRFSGEPVKRPM